MYSSPTFKPLTVTSPFAFVVIFLPVAGNPSPVNLYLTLSAGLDVPFSVFFIFNLTFTSSSTSILTLYPSVSVG